MPQCIQLESRGEERSVVSFFYTIVVVVGFEKGPQAHVFFLVVLVGSTHHSFSNAGTRIKACSWCGWKSGNNMEATYRGGWCFWIMDGKANLLMDRKVVASSSYLSVHLPVYLSVYLLIYLSVCPSVRGVHLSVCLSVQSIHLSICLSVCGLSNDLTG